MTKCILIYANCSNPQAKGDYSFAAAIAKELAQEIEKCQYQIDVILTTTLESVKTFESIYGQAVNDEINISGRKIKISALELFDAVDNTVIAFIEANRCKYAPADIIKCVLSPDSKLIFIGNCHQPEINHFLLKLKYYENAKTEQNGLYEYFELNDVLIGAAGVGENRLGLPEITPAKDISLSNQQMTLIPATPYGFIYLNKKDIEIKVYIIIAEYMTLTRFNHYVMIGDFKNNYPDIAFHYRQYTNQPYPSMPQIDFYPSLDFALMRHIQAKTHGTLVATTGIMSTLEAMQDGKLAFYQDLSLNADFVTSYLLAVESVCSNHPSLTGCMAKLIIELSKLLFENKPLSDTEMARISELMQMSPVTNHLIQTNKKIINQSIGKLSSLLLSFINIPKQTSDITQVSNALKQLEKPRETHSPTPSQALRRSAYRGSFFEMKILLHNKYIIPSQIINDKDQGGLNRSALHWAVINNKIDCLRLLISKNADVNIQDAEAMTPLHYAVKSDKKDMIKLLVQAGAALDIYNKSGKRPCDEVSDSIKKFVIECQASYVPHTYTKYTK